MKFDNYKFRAHMVGKLVSLPKPLTEKQSETLQDYRQRAKGLGRALSEKQEATWHSLEHKCNESKVYKLNETAKKELTDIVMYEKYKRRPKLDTKYFTKGLACEKEGRDLLSEVMGTYLTVDKKRKSNEWVTGERDIEHHEVIIDIKSSFQFKTFNNHLLESVSDMYLRQLDCYMELWGLSDSLLAFVLVNTPMRLIEDELRRMDFKQDIFDFGGEVRNDKIDEVKALVCEHIYDFIYLEAFCEQSTSIRIEWFDDFKEIPKVERVHLVSHSFDPVRIEQRNECIKIAREYMNNVQPVNNITIKDKLFL